MTTTYLSGTLSGNGIGDGDTLIVTSGGIDEDYTVNSGGLLVVSSGGLALSGSLPNNYNYGSGPAAEVDVYSGGVASATVIEGGLQVLTGGTSYDVWIEGGEQTVSSGGIAYNTIISGPYGLVGTGYGDQEEQLVASGGRAIGTFVGVGEGEFTEGISPFSGQLVVGGGASVAGTTVSGLLTEYFGANGNTLAEIDAQIVVSSGAVASNTVLDILGNEVVSSGGLIAGTTVLGGNTVSLFGIGPETGNATLTLNGPAGSGTIDFEGPSKLIVSGMVMPTNEITHITGNASIDLASIPVSTVTGVEATADQLIVETTGGNEVLNVVGADTRSYPIADDGHGGTELLATLCYLRGTRILTPTGERPVESLRIGDMVVTRYSGLREIRWIGRQSYSGRFLCANNRKAPVRIRAGALGEDLPARDLLISPGHSMLLRTPIGEERLVLASSLINGITITQDEIPEEVHYYQLDLLGHDCVIAEGAWSETYGDGDRLRGQFHNVAEFWELYPDHREPEELILCASRPERGPKLDEALRPVVLRAMAGIMPGPLSGCIDLIPTPWKVEGWAHDSDYPHLPVLLEVLLRDEPIGTVLAYDHRSDLEQAGIGHGRCAFAFSSPVRLPVDAMHEIRVRRASDGAEIAMSEACRSRIDLDYSVRRHVRRA